MRLKNLLMGALLVSAVGCAELDKFTQATEKSLAKPITTQPGSPTNEQALLTTAAVLGPYGVLGTGLFLYAVKSYNSSRANKRKVTAAGGE